MKRDWVTGFDPLLDWVAMKTTLSGTVVMTEYTLMPVGVIFLIVLKESGETRSE